MFQYSTSPLDLGGWTKCSFTISNNLAATMSSVASSSVKGKSLSENMAQFWGGGGESGVRDGVMEEAFHPAISSHTKAARR